MKSSARQQGNKPLRAVFWMLGWAFLFTILMAVNKKINPTLPRILLAFVRLFFGTIVLIPFVLREGVMRLKTRQLPFHLLRGFFMSLSVGCTYYAYFKLPMAFATSLGFTGPLFTTLLAIGFLKEKVTLKRWGLILLGYLGVLVIVHPHALVLDKAILASLASNLFAGSAVITGKKLAKTESTLQLMVYPTFIAACLLGFYSAPVWQPLSFQDTGALLLLGTIGICSQFCYVKAIQSANPSFLAPFEYLRLVLAVPIGFYCFHERPSIETLIGSLVIIATSYALTRIEAKR